MDALLIIQLVTLVICIVLLFIKDSRAVKVIAVLMLIIQIGICGVTYLTINERQKVRNSPGCAGAYDCVVDSKDSKFLRCKVMDYSNNEVEVTCINNNSIK